MALAAGSRPESGALRRLLEPYAERLLLAEPPAAATLLPAPLFADPGQVRARVERYANRLGATDLRAAASVWNKQYNAAVLMGVLTAMTLGGIGLDARLSNASILLEEDLPRAMLLHDLTGSVVCLERRSCDVEGLRPVGLAELHRVVSEGAFAGHLAPVIEALYGASGISRRILWGNAGNLTADLYDKWGTQPGRPALEDRLYLLERRESPLLPGRPNPIWGSVRYVTVREPDLPPVVRVRNTCCQRSRLPGGTTCSTCPLLTEEERVAVLRGAW